MSRKSFAIWFAIFILLQWFAMAPFVGIHYFLEMILSMICSAVLLSNILGIAMIGFLFYWGIGDLWGYFSDNANWITNHNGYSTYAFVDALVLVAALMFILHFILCAKRCKYIGISGWWSLVPLYNPIMLLYKKSKADSEETVHN